MPKTGSRPSHVPCALIKWLLVTAAFIIIICTFAVLKMRINFDDAMTLLKLLFKAFD